MRIELKFLGGFVLFLNCAETQSMHLPEAENTKVNNVLKVEIPHDITDTEMGEDSHDSSLRPSLDEKQPLNDANTTSYTQKTINALEIPSDLNQRLQEILSDQEFLQLINKGNLWNWFSGMRSNNLNEFIKNLSALTENEFDTKMHDIRINNVITRGDRRLLIRYHFSLTHKPKEKINKNFEKTAASKPANNKNKPTNIEFEKPIKSYTIDSHGDIILSFN